MDLTDLLGGIILKTHTISSKFKPSNNYVYREMYLRDKRYTSKTKRTAKRKILNCFK